MLPLPFCKWRFWPEILWKSKIDGEISSKLPLITAGYLPSRVKAEKNPSTAGFRTQGEWDHRCGILRAQQRSPALENDSSLRNIGPQKWRYPKNHWFPQKPLASPLKLRLFFTQTTTQACGYLVRLEGVEHSSANQLPQDRETPLPVFLPFPRKITSLGLAQEGRFISTTWGNHQPMPPHAANHYQYRKAVAEISKRCVFVMHGWQSALMDRKVVKALSLSVSLFSVCRFVSVSLYLSLCLSICLYISSVV